MRFLLKYAQVCYSLHNIVHEDGAPAILRHCCFLTFSGLNFEKIDEGFFVSIIESVSSDVIKKLVFSDMLVTEVVFNSISKYCSNLDYLGFFFCRLNSMALLQKYIPEMKLPEFIFVNCHRDRWDNVNTRWNGSMYTRADGYTVEDSLRAASLEETLTNTPVSIYSHTVMNESF